MMAGIFYPMGRAVLKPKSRTGEPLVLEVQTLLFNNFVTWKN